MNRPPARRVVCDSGNGYHLLYKVDLSNDAENRSLLESVLFSSDAWAPYLHDALRWKEALAIAPGLLC